jgi:hypothetical protein
MVLQISSYSKKHTADLCVVSRATRRKMLQTNCALRIVLLHHLGVAAMMALTAAAPAYFG